MFIRSVAQLDISTAPKVRRDIYNSSTFGRPQAFRSRQLIQNRCNSTSSSAPVQSIDQDESQARPINSKQWEEGVETQVKDGGSNFESAFAEISPESIDAIAAESISKNEYPVPVQEPFTQEPAAHARPPRKRDMVESTPSNITFRKTGFTSNSSPKEESSNIMFKRIGFTPDSRARQAAIRLLSDSPQESGSFEKDASKAPVEDDWVPPKKEPWQIHKAAMKEKFPEGWNPLKRLSPDAMTGIRALHQQMPEMYTTRVLADHFKVSPEAIRRILKSKWQPSADTQVDREMRWFRRGERVWSRYAELGVKPPRKWRDEGIGRGKPEWKKKKEEPRSIPALVTTARREDSYHGSNGVAPINSERPQLVTTTRPPTGH
jgi:hypothetical protein